MGDDLRTLLAAAYREAYGLGEEQSVGSADALLATPSGRILAERQAPAAEALAAAHALLRRASDYLHFFSPTENYPVSPLRDDIDAALAATPTTPHQRIVHLAATPEPPAREVG